MALTIRMRIDENDEHSYYYATGSGSEIELIPLVVDANGVFVPDEGKAYNRVTVNVPETELETLIVDANGTYNAPDGKAYNVVQVNVQQIINLQNKSASYSSNGNYTIQADSGYDGLGTVSVAVSVPTPHPNLQEKSVSYSANDDYVVYPDSGYDGLSKVNVEVDVQGGATLVPLSDVVNANGLYTATPPAGADGFSDVSIDVQVPTGGASDIVRGTFTTNPTTGAQEITIPYNGSGYISNLFIFNNNALSTDDNHSIWGVFASKLNKNVAPLYAGRFDDNDAEYGAFITRNSDSASASSSSFSQSSFSGGAYKDQEASSSSNTTRLRIRSANTISIFVRDVSGSYSGFKPSTTYNYIIEYSS